MQDIGKILNRSPDYVYKGKVDLDRKNSSNSSSSSMKLITEATLSKDKEDQ